MKTAYLREYVSTSQCELSFSVEIPNGEFGCIIEDVRAVRRTSDTVSSLLQHIKNKIHKVIQDKDKENCNDEGRKAVNIPVALKKNYRVLKDECVLKNLINNVNQTNFTFEIFNQEYDVIINAPLIKNIKLPIVVFAGFSIQPTNFHAIFTETKNSTFWWYKSLDKVKWTKVNDSYFYVVNAEDIGHYLKLVCIPRSNVNLKGPPYEVVSECKVESIGELPVCPFEERHQFTKNKTSQKEFRIVSYNILSERYTDDRFPYCTEKALAIDYRKQLIFKELIGYNADIICLQEVDNRHYTSYFKDKFRECNYGSSYNRKGNRIPEGLAFFYDKSRFKQISCQHIVLTEVIQKHKSMRFILEMIQKNSELRELFMKQATSAQIVVLKEKDRNSFLIIANTHLFYHPDASHIRLLQINVITAFVTFLNKKIKREGDTSVIICGDFNSNPDTSFYEFLTNGNLSCDHEDCLKISRSGCLLYHTFALKSAYGTPKYTNYTDDFKGCLDYIFVEYNKLDIVQNVPLTNEETLSKYVGLPNEVFPSDHLALVTDLMFKY